MAKDNYVLTERDQRIFNEINRFRFCLARHIMVFAGFPSMRTCNRRIAKLIDMGYLKKQKLLYGVPHLYTVTSKIKGVCAVPYYKHSIRLDKVHHDITVLDTVLYFKQKFKLSMEQIKSEKELHSLDGFSKRTHQPDFVFNVGDRSFCVEVELSAKSKARLESNLKANFRNYDGQFWIVPHKPDNIRKTITSSARMYANIDIIDLGMIQNEPF